MSDRVFRLNDPDEYRKAGPDDLIRLEPAPGVNALFLAKQLLEKLVYAIVTHEFIHLSGPTGSAKSSLLEALYLNQANFAALCMSIGFPVLPLRVYPIETATYETPGELYQRRALKGGSTFDEKSRLVEALEDAAAGTESFYPLIWLREIGRVHSVSVQGGLLNLMTKGDIPLSDGSHARGGQIAWVADSNYQAESDSVHTLVTFDDALKRRFGIQLTLHYLAPEEEIQVLRHVLLENDEKGEAKLHEEAILKAVHLGNVIRRHRSEGNLQSLPPPTIWGYLAFLRMSFGLPHLSLPQIATSTLLGNASAEDKKTVAVVLNEVFGLQETSGEELAANLF
jgi:hypothetical protein